MECENDYLSIIQSSWWNCTFLVVLSWWALFKTKNIYPSYSLYCISFSFHFLSFLFKHTTHSTFSYRLDLSAGLLFPDLTLICSNEGHYTKACNSNVCTTTITVIVHPYLSKHNMYIHSNEEGNVLFACNTCTVIWLYAPAEDTHVLIKDFSTLFMYFTTHIQVSCIVFFKQSPGNYSTRHRASEKMSVGYGVAPPCLLMNGSITAGLRSNESGNVDEDEHRVQLLVHCCVTK